MLTQYFNKVAFPILAFILFFCASNIKWGNERWKSLLSHDALGYYSYLPAVFIYNDLDYRFIEQIDVKYNQIRNPYILKAHPDIQGGKKNRYYCGTAISLLPFFFIAHFISGIIGADQDGYSKLYLIIINVAAICYLLTGLIVLFRFLKPVALTEGQKTLLLFSTVFGTNIFYYVINEPGMSHIYSFTFVITFLYYSQQYFIYPKSKYLLILAALLGLITIIRPVNALVILLLPFTAGNYRSLKKGLQYLIQKPTITVIGLLIFTVILIPQLLIYKHTEGVFFYYSYTGEGFNFLEPHFFDILFSYRKGLFLYTPLFFIALFGGYYLFKHSGFQFFSLFLFLIVLTYVLSSWWCWYYGGSFSGRPYLEFTGLFIFLLAITLKNLKPPVLNRIYVSVIILLIMVCQFQTYQYRKAYIHWSDMTKEQYWDVFLNPDKLLVSSKNKK